jgi:hypothetical protein
MADFVPKPVREAFEPEIVQLQLHYLWQDVFQVRVHKDSGTFTYVQKNTYYAQTTSRTLPTCDMGLVIIAKCSYTWSQRLWNPTILTVIFFRQYHSTHAKRSLINLIWTLRSIILATHIAI